MTQVATEMKPLLASEEEKRKLAEYEGKHNINVIRCCENCKRDRDKFAGYSCGTPLIHSVKNVKYGVCDSFIFDDSSEPKYIARDKRDRAEMMQSRHLHSPITDGERKARQDPEVRQVIDKFCSLYGGQYKVENEDWEFCRKQIDRHGLEKMLSHIVNCFASNHGYISQNCHEIYSMCREGVIKRMDIILKKETGGDEKNG